MTAPTSFPALEVSVEGLSQVIERRGGKPKVITELVQNSWDEDGVSRFTVELALNAVEEYARLLDDEDASKSERRKVLAAAEKLANDL